jgi:hypothetical protein
MSVTCLDIIQELNKSVDNINTTLIHNMTNSSMKYEWVCIKPNVTYDYFYQCLKEEWGSIINQFINQPNKCTSHISELMELYQYLTPEKIAYVRQIFNELTTEETSGLTKKGLSSINIDNIVLDVVATSLMDPNENIYFELNPNFMETMQGLGSTLTEYCQCQLVDIFKIIIKKYKKKYHKKFQGKPKEEVIDMLRDDYNKFKQMLKKFGMTGKVPTQNNFIDKIATQLTGLYGFSMENELDRLIPKELGSLKDFFITVISKYYNNLHPIVWAQIFKNITENIFIDLPFTPEEIFSFVSKYLLLNSGPFILKILQMIRPVLSPELATKYNLTKLTYPILKPHQIDIILQRVVYNWDMYKILQNFSASVGHVCKVIRVDNPSNIFMIKIIKPVAVAQSCWEYQTLYDIYPHGSCENAFIKHMLESNGRELNVNNEIEHINKGHKYYTGTYRDLYGTDINATITAIQNIPGIIIPGTWFALTMTLAPGIPLSKLVEQENNPLLMTDNDYRARLHRCLDLLVYKFFLNIVTNGFYHGDLHAGNIFFSYENSQMTLIDFGAVGELDIYANDPDIKILLDIVVMSMFSNYEDMLETMTQLLNSKCIETQIDSTKPEYQELKQRLASYRINNILVQEKEHEKTKQFEHDIFSNERISAENKAYQEMAPQEMTQTMPINSIYSYLEYKPSQSETIIENREVLPPFTTVAKTEGVGFTNVLEEIIKYYALSGVNIAIKFNEFYEFQKAYALLLGVLYKVKYNPYRTGIAIRKAIVNWKNIPELMHISTVTHFIKSWTNQRNIFNEFKKHMNLQPELTTEARGKNISSCNKSNQLIKSAMAQDLSISGINDEDNEFNLANGNDDEYYIKYLKYKAKFNKLMA